MQYLNMRPDKLRNALDEKVPVAFPLGVIEYQAEHLPWRKFCLEPNRQ